MNLFIHGRDGGIELGNSYHDDQHPDLKADYVLANPPFNGGAKGERGWGAHRIQRDDPRLVVDAGELSHRETARLAVRKALIEGNCVDCIVQLTGQLFANTQIPCSLWFLSKSRKGGSDRAGSCGSARGAFSSLTAGSWAP